jgi:cation:H+ antiporter
MNEALWPLVGALLIATVLAGIGGELFVRGVVGVAQRWALPELLVAMTVAACATSAPELTVTIAASASGSSALAMGDALGSNITNILLILGMSLLMGPLPADARALRWHVGYVLAAPLVTAALVADGTLSRWDGSVLWVGFVAWLWFTVASGRRTRAQAATSQVGGMSAHAGLLLVYLAAGVGILAVAGYLFAQGGRAMARAFDIPDAVVGATVVALGTSMPELMTTLVSRWRGHHDVGLGTLLGSNLFNGLAILGTAAVIAPVQVPLLPTWIMLLLGAGAVLLAMPCRGELSRMRGVLMLACYAMYVTALGVVLGLGSIR